MKWVKPPKGKVHEKMVKAAKLIMRGYPIQYTCKVLRLSTATYYKYQHLYAGTGATAWHGKS